MADTKVKDIMAISIHPPRVGRDGLRAGRKLSGGEFQSPRPGWGGTQRVSSATQDMVISIHPPRVGRDRLSRGLVS